MENHPIPQDVTGFKFKLIGSMTVKQFLYLLGFGILAGIMLIFNINPLIKYPLMLLFGSIGVALAFVPIEGRPFDVMFMNFAKTIPSENRYIFKKRGVNLSTFEFFKIVVVAPTPTPKQAAKIAAQPKESTNDDRKAELVSRLRNSNFKPDESETKMLNNIKSLFGDAGGSIINPAAGTPNIDSVPKTPPAPQIIAADKNPEEATPIQIAPANNVDLLKKELENAKKMQADKLGNQEALSAKIKELEEELEKTSLQNQELARKVVDYEVASTKKEEQVFKPAEPQVAKEETQNVSFVAPTSSLQAGFPSLPDIANVIIGKISDPRGKMLPNILVEVVDQNNVPVRAFKTNSLGQFASATPLANGTYKVYFEDPGKKHEFQIVEITLDGKITNPIAVVSVDSREKLRRELFGGQAAAA